MYGLSTPRDTELLYGVGDIKDGLTPGAWPKNEPSSKDSRKSLRVWEWVGRAKSYRDHNVREDGEFVHRIRGIEECALCHAHSHARPS